MPIYDTFLTLSGVSEIKKYVLKEINNVIQKAIDQSLSLFFSLSDSPRIRFGIQTRSTLHFFINSRVLKYSLLQ